MAVQPVARRQRAPLFETADGSTPSAAMRPAGVDMGQNNMQPAAGAAGTMGQQQMRAPRTVPTGAAAGRLASTAAQTQSVVPTSTPAVDTSVSGRASTIASKGGALFDRATFRGQQYAQNRGLLSSSIAAGAAEAAVVDQAQSLAAQDVSADLQQRAQDVDEKIRLFQAGLDQRRFESDTAYRQKALETQAALDRDRLALDTARLAQERTLTREGLAQEKLIADQRLGLDTSRLAQEAALTGRDQALREKTQRESQALAKLEADRMEHHRGTQRVHEWGRLEMEKGQIEFSQGITERQMSLEETKAVQAEAHQEHIRALDDKRFESDDKYRNDQIKIQQDIQKLDQARFTEESRRWDREFANRQHEFKTRQEFDQYVFAESIRLDRDKFLHEQEKDLFYQQLDVDKFHADEKYRAETLRLQEKQINNEQAINNRRIHLEHSSLKVRERQALAQSASNAIAAANQFKLSLFTDPTPPDDLDARIAEIDRNLQNEIASLNNIYGVPMDDDDRPTGPPEGTIEDPFAEGAFPVGDGETGTGTHEPGTSVAQPTKPEPSTPATPPNVGDPPDAGTPTTVRTTPRTTGSPLTSRRNTYGQSPNTYGQSPNTYGQARIDRENRRRVNPVG